MQIANPGPGGPTPDGANAQALAERRRKRNRRRLGAWGAFLLLGLALGAIYATGFATITGSGVPGEAEANSNTPGEKQDESELNGKVDTVTSPLVYNWAGRWGDIETTLMYELKLGTFENTEKFFAEVLLIDSPAGFSDLQLQLRIVEIDKEATCDAAAETALEAAESGDWRVMIFDTDDAQVTFSEMDEGTPGLKGEANYCIGIAEYSGSGKDTGGTFIRRAKPTEEPSEYPKLVATLNRMQ